MTARCGTEGFYRRHLRHREVPCWPCCDAHALHMANWRAVHADLGPIEPGRFTAALAGREPAEALCSADRLRLVGQLHRAGYTDVEVASRCRMSTYTAARLRTALRLPPNPPAAVAASGRAA